MEYDKRIEIRYLLELYFEGETTLEQERRLKEYFSGDDIPGDLEYARAMFGFFCTTAGDRMEGGLDMPSCEEAAPVVFTESGTGAETGLPSPSASRPGKKVLGRRMSMAYRAVSVAAIILLTVGITFTVTRQAGRATVYCYVDGQPVTDPEVASRQAEMAARILEGGLKASANGLSAAGDAGRVISSISNALYDAHLSEDGSEYE